MSASVLNPAKKHVDWHVATTCFDGFKSSPQFQECAVLLAALENDDAEDDFVEAGLLQVCAHAQICSRAHTLNHKHIHLHTHALTRARSRTHTHTHTHTHSHTHTQLSIRYQLSVEAAGRRRMTLTLGRLTDGRTTGRVRLHHSNACASHTAMCSTHPVIFASALLTLCDSHLFLLTFKHA